MRGRVSKIEIYAKFLHTNSTRAQAPACSSLSRLISPRAYLWYTPWNPLSHRGGRFRCTASGASHSDRVRCGLVSRRRHTRTTPMRPERRGA